MVLKMIHHCPLLSLLILFCSVFHCSKLWHDFYQTEFWRKKPMWSEPVRFSKFIPHSHCVMSTTLLLLSWSLLWWGGVRWIFLIMCILCLLKYHMHITKYTSITKELKMKNKRSLAHLLHSQPCSSEANPSSDFGAPPGCSLCISIHRVPKLPKHFESPLCHER